MKYLVFDFFSKNSEDTLYTINGKVFVNINDAMWEGMSLPNADEQQVMQSIETWTRPNYILTSSESLNILQKVVKTVLAGQKEYYDAIKRSFEAESELAVEDGDSIERSRNSKNAVFGASCRREFEKLGISSEELSAIIYSLHQRDQQAYHEMLSTTGLVTDELDQILHAYNIEMTEDQYQEWSKIVDSLDEDEIETQIVGPHHNETRYDIYPLQPFLPFFQKHNIDHHTCEMGCMRRAFYAQYEIDWKNGKIKDMPIA